MLVSKFLTSKSKFSDILETVRSSLLTNKLLVSEMISIICNNDLDILVLRPDESQEMRDHSGLMHCYTVPWVLKK